MFYLFVNPVPSNSIGFIFNGTDMIELEYYGENYSYSDLRTVIPFYKHH